MEDFTQFPNGPLKAKIFQTKISLQFSDQIIAKNWRELIMNKSYINLLITLLILLLGFTSNIILIIIYRNELLVIFEVNELIIISATSVGIITTLLLLCLLPKLRTNLLFNDITQCFILILADIYFNTTMILSSTSPDHNHMESKYPVLLVLMITFTSYVSLHMMNNVKVFLVSILIASSLQWIYAYLLLDKHNSMVIIAHYIYYFVLSFTFYCKQVSSRINFFAYCKSNEYLANAKIKAEPQSTKDTPIENINAAYFSINEYGIIEIMNKSTKRLIKRLQRKNLQTQEIKNIHFEDLNTNNISLKVSTKKKLIQSDNNFPLKPRFPLIYESYKHNELKFTNESNADMKRKQTTKVAFESETRTLEQALSNIVQINEELPENLHKYFNTVIPSRSRTTKDPSAFVETHTNNFSFMKIFELLNPNVHLIRRISENKLCSSKHRLLNYSSLNDSVVLEETKHIPHRRRTGTNKGFNNNQTFTDEYILIGKAIIKSPSSKKRNSTSAQDQKLISREYHLYYRYHSSMTKVEFLMEDLSSILNKERKTTAFTCRSLYLSKISHEFRNPICSLIEMLNFISDDMNQIQESKPGSSNMILPNQVNGINIKDVVNRTNSNVVMLKNICDMLLHLVKDFTFYSTINEEDEELTSLDRRMSTVSLFKRLTDDINTTKKENLPSKNLSGLTSKICHYKEIIVDIVNIFKIKAKTDQIDHKLNIAYKPTSIDAEVIDCDKELFASLVFNLLYQSYKTAHSGNIFVSITETQKEACRVILFEFLIVGICKSGTISNMIKNKELVQQIINDNIEEIDEDSSFDSSVGSMINTINKNASSSIFEENSKCLSTKSIMKEKAFFVENFHLQNIFKISDPRQRNLVIEDFNNNFCVYMSHIYAKRLGFNLQMESSTNNTRLYFNVEIPNKRNFEHQLLMHRNKTISERNSMVSHFNIIRSNTVDDSFLKNVDRHLSPILFHNSSKVLSRKDTPIFANVNSYSNEILKKYTKNSEQSNKTIEYCQEFNFDYSTYGDYVNLFNDERDRDVSHLLQKNFTSNYNEIDNKRAVSECLSHGVNNHFSPIEFNQQKKAVRSSFNSTSKTLFKILAKEKEMNRRDTLNHSSHNLKPLQLEEINHSINQFSSNVGKENILSTYRVLLVDDESLVRRGLNRYFNTISKEESITFDIQHADNGLECLNIIYNYHIEGKIFDLMIIDENMPYIKGSQIINILNGIFEMGDMNKFLIVSYTSYDSVDKKNYIISQGADFVINKPMKYSDFKEFFFTQLKTSS